jgi:hypothetical protein
MELDDIIIGADWKLTRNAEAIPLARDVAPGNTAAMAPIDPNNATKKNAGRIREK